MKQTQDQQPAHDPRQTATSPGNEGARGSRGQANRGAQEADSTNERGNERAEGGSTPPDLRDAPAQGGGGAGSDSSRSR